MALEYRFRTIDFRPAGDGWRYALLLDDDTVEITALPGWLIEEEVEYGPGLGENGRPTGDHRVTAAHIDWYSLEPFEGVDSFWCIIAPGQSDPTPQEITAERARREANRVAMASNRATGEQP